MDGNATLALIYARVAFIGIGLEPCGFRLFGVGGLLLFGREFLLQGLQCVEVAESGLFDCGSDNLLLLFGAGCAGLAVLVVGGATFSLLGVFADAAVAQDDALAVLVELYDLEGEFLVEFGL